MISAYAGKEEEARCAELGVNVFVRKPVTTSSLFDAIMESQGVRVHSVRRGLDTPLEREFDGVRALLAEDNEANQMVAIELLGRLGIELDIAGNGREAIQLAQAAPARYEAILMDMQMPELDGLARDPGAACRSALRESANHRDDGERDEGRPRCVSRRRHERPRDETDRSPGTRRNPAAMAPAPAEPTPAVATLVSPTEPVASSASIASPAAGRESESVLEGIDVNGTLQRLGIDRATLERMLLRFADGQQEVVDALRAAVIAGDGVMAARHAHAIAGASGNLGADGLRSAAKALEQSAREGRTDLSGLLAALEERAAVVFRSIEALRPAGHRGRRHGGRPVRSGGRRGRPRTPGRGAGGL